MTLDGSLRAAMVRDMIEDSYDLVVEKLPRARRRALLWSPARVIERARPHTDADLNDS